MTDTWDDDDRAIARAIGADAAAGRAPLDDDAVADYEAVLALLPLEEIDPPSGLEDRVVAAALARRPAAARSIDARRSGAPARTRTAWRRIGAGAAAVAAAAIVVVLLAGRTPSVPGSPAARIRPAADTGDLNRVLAESGTRRGVLRTPAGASGGRVVLDSKGSGYLTGLKLPPANPYWLWLDTGSSPVRVGRLPPSASAVHFVVRGDVGAVRGVIVSPASGSPEPFSLRARFG